MTGEQQPKAVVEIGLAEIYNTLVDVRENVVAMRSEQDTEKAKVADHEARVRVLEQTTVTREEMRASHNRTVAVITVVCTVVGAIAALAAVLLPHA